MAEKIKAVIRETGRITAAVGGRDTTPAKWMGKWQPEKRYGALHKVEHLGSSYVCIKGCVGVDPEADVTLGNGVEGTCWIMIAKRGDRGAAFTYADFTEAQLEALKGRPFTYADFTQEQLEALRGRAFTYDDFTEAQLEALRGRAFTYEDFTAEQLEALRGPAGPSGSGTGDMTAAVYDPQGKAQDIFNYVDEKLKGVDFDVTADEVTFADGQNFQQKYDSGDLTGPAGPQGPAGQDGKNGQDGQPGATGPAGANGQPGAAGKDATINGVNALTVQAGDGIEATMSGTTLTIKAKSVETWTFTLEDDSTVTKKVVLV